MKQKHTMNGVKKVIIISTKKKYEQRRNNARVSNTIKLLLLTVNVVDETVCMFSCVRMCRGNDEILES